MRHWMPPTTVRKASFCCALVGVEDVFWEEVASLGLAAKFEEASSRFLFTDGVSSCHVATLAREEDVAIATDSAKNLSG